MSIRVSPGDETSDPTESVDAHTDLSIQGGGGFRGRGDADITRDSEG